MRLYDVILVLLVVAVVAYLLSAVRRQRERSRAIVSSESRGGALSPGVTPTPADAAAWVHSPIVAMSFEESLDLQRFAAACEESAVRELNSRIASGLPDGLSATVNGVATGSRAGTLVVSFSEAGQRLLRAGEAGFATQKSTGNRVAQLVVHGRASERAVEVSGTQFLSNVAGATAMLVSVAHLVAGKDLADRLSRVESKLDSLQEGRLIDQRAKLYRVYTSARELLHGPMTEDSRTEIWRLRGELRELRCVWLQEATRKVNQIEDPSSASFLGRTFTSRRSIAERIAGQMSKVTGELRLVEYSMRLEYAMAIAAGSLDEFWQSEEEDLGRLDKLRVLMKQKSDCVDSSHRELSTQPLVDSVSAMLDAYGEMLLTNGSDTTTAAS